MTKRWARLPVFVASMFVACSQPEIPVKTATPMPADGRPIDAIVRDYGFTPLALPEGGFRPGTVVAAEGPGRYSVLCEPSDVADPDALVRRPAMAQTFSGRTGKSGSLDVDALLLLKTELKMSALSEVDVTLSDTEVERVAMSRLQHASARCRNAMGRSPNPLVVVEALEATASYVVRTTESLSVDAQARLATKLSIRGGIKSESARELRGSGSALVWGVKLAHFEPMQCNLPEPCKQSAVVGRDCRCVRCDLTSGRELPAEFYLGTSVSLPIRCPDMPNDAKLRVTASGKFTSGIADAECSSSRGSTSFWSGQVGLTSGRKVLQSKLKERVEGWADFDLQGTFERNADLSPGLVAEAVERKCKEGSVSDGRLGFKDVRITVEVP